MRKISRYAINKNETLTQNQIVRYFPFVQLLGFVCTCVPVGHRVHPFIRKFCGSNAFLRVPWGAYQLTIFSDWMRLSSSALAPLYQTPYRLNREFFEILAPELPRLQAGVIVDVGANIGTYTLNLRSRCQSPIVAFEPDPHIFCLLEENVRFNRLPFVTLRNVACGDTAGALLFRSGINGNVVADPDRIGPLAGRTDAEGASERRALMEEDGTISVPVVRLDDELQQFGPICLIKIDCEGFEWHVLKGCVEIIRAHCPLLFIELHPKMILDFGHTPHDVFELLRPYYRLYFWDVDPAQRSPSRLVRFFGRYRGRVVQLRSEPEMLALASGSSAPDQLFLLGVPRGR